VIPVLAALAGAMLAGCAGTQTVGSDRTLQVGVTEYRVSPSSVRVSPGPLTIIVHNYGRLTHDLVITQGGPQGGPKEAFAGNISPGRTAEMSVDLPKGRYTMASSVISDEALGAYASLTVS
jgi:hypothetical protein